MFEVARSKYFLYWTDYYFRDDISKPRFYLSIYNYVYSENKSCFFVRARKSTLITDLRKSESEIERKIRKNFRYDIRRASKEQLTYRVSKDESIEFLRLYKLLAKEFDLPIIHSDDLLSFPVKNRLFTVVEQGGNILAIHFYILDDKVVRLNYSVTVNGRGSVDSQEVGRANKWLHWEDIKYFKGNAIQFYDWGGVEKSEIDAKKNGINKFKCSFGGEERVYCNFVSAPLYILLALRAVFRKILTLSLPIFRSDSQD